MFGHVQLRSVSYKEMWVNIRNYWTKYTCYTLGEPADEIQDLHPENQVNQQPDEHKEVNQVEQVNHL